MGWIRKYVGIGIILMFLSVSPSLAFFFFKDRQEWSRYDFGDKTQEEQASIVEDILSSAIPDSIVAKLQKVEINQCTLIIETKYLRPCKDKFDRGTTIYSRKIVDLTELSDNIDYDAKIILPDEYSVYSFVFWKYKPDIAKSLSEIRSRMIEMLNEQIQAEIKAGQSADGAERSLKLSKIREEEINSLGIVSRTIDRICKMGDQIRGVSPNYMIRVKPDQDDKVLSSLATYKLTHCRIKEE